MKQTAVEWLQEQLKDVKYNPLETNGYLNALERLYDQAKEMEKQQERSYSEEEVLELLDEYHNDAFAYTRASSASPKEWFEQFKNK